MKLLIYSDLHLEFAHFEPPTALQYDVVILAGDIGVGTKGVEWANKTFTDKPVLYVHGNHEHYRHNKVGPNIAAARAVANKNVYIIDNSDVTIDGQHFIGGTLWTDFRLYGDPNLSAVIAESNMNDFRVIDREPYGKFRASDSTKLHHETRNYLKENIAVGSVVITHHGPSEQSVHNRYGRDALNPAYVSDLSGLIHATEPKLWIHGHVHSSFDYMESATRVVTNPRGYVDENKDFDPAFILEV